MISNHTKPFLLNLASIRVIYASPDWLSTDRNFMDAVEQVIHDNVSNRNTEDTWYRVSAPDYDPSRADSTLAPGRDLARQYGDYYNWDQHQQMVLHTKRRHSRRIRIRPATRADRSKLPKLSELIKKNK